MRECVDAWKRGREEEWIDVYACLSAPDHNTTPVQYRAILSDGMRYDATYDTAWVLQRAHSYKDVAKITKDNPNEQNTKQT